MKQRNQGQRQSQAHTPCAGEEEGLYVYCIGRGGKESSLGTIGIEGHEVYAVVHNDLCALVHDCLAQPYQSEDGEVVGAWVLAHHRVVEAAWKQWPAVLPLVFNTMIKPTQWSAQENLVAWLEMEEAPLQGKLDAFRGKVEYGVQVSWDPTIIGKQVADASPEIRELEEEVRSKPRGLAYMYRQKLERLLKSEMEARGAAEFKRLYRRLSRCVDNINIEKTKRGEEGHQMLINLSCLLSIERYPDLEEEIDKIRTTEGFFVRLVGPLPPYSFC